jgi:hypothetical protein
MWAFVFRVLLSMAFLHFVPLEIAPANTMSAPRLWCVCVTTMLGSGTWRYELTLQPWHYYLKQYQMGDMD